MSSCPQKWKISGLRIDHAHHTLKYNGWVSLNKEQFDSIWAATKSKNRFDKRTISGERFLNKNVLGDLAPDTDATFITHDGYGLEATPMGGLRSVFDPSGNWIADVPTHKEGVQEIQRHRDEKK